MGGRSSFAGGIARLAVVALVSTAAAPAAGDGVTLVEAGRANAVICFSSGSKEAADILGRHIRQMSGVNLLIQEVASKAEVQDAVAAVILGEAAREFGLRVDGSSPSHEAFHLKTEGNRILLDGDSPSAVEWGVYEILERLGCGWYFDLPAGEVAPKRETITLPPVDTTQSPAFETRKLWGSGWTGPSDFKRWNRTGGIEAQTSHAWSRLVPPKEYGQSHPEYYPLRNGERSPGRQLCTTNPDVIRIAQDYVLKRLEEGAPSVSISPDDGGGFCECDRCRALDTPGYLEPSSGRICLTDRLMEFFNQVAGPAHERFPDRRVNFYAYADYSLPPKRVRAASSNLMAWMTPIRYCRIHGMAGEEDCPRRQSLKATIQDWAQVVRQFGLREYNYDLAECLVPFSKIHVWRSDLPWLHEAGCRAVNLESIHSIAVMGPSIWLSARLAWDVNADVDALMKRYWNDLFGERAGPVMKRYWDRIDAAWAHCPSHAGSFFCVPAVYTDELLKACRNDLNRAKDLIDDDAGRERWAIFDSGFQNAELYMNMLRLFNAGKYPEAAEALGRLRTHLAEALAKGWLNKYSQSYLERFAAAAIDQAAARAGGGNEVVATLPDVWRFRPDDEDAGESREFFGPKEVGQWRDVKTYGATLEELGVPDKLTVLWYRASLAIPSRFPGRRLGLWFAGADRDVQVWVNGQPVEAEVRDRATGQWQKSLVAKSGPPVQFDITEAVQFDRPNLLALKVDHRAMTDLALGGLVKPVMVYAAAPGQGLYHDPEPAPAAKAKKPAQAKTPGGSRKTKSNDKGKAK